jgi:hypothetical protein
MSDSQLFLLKLAKQYAVKGDVSTASVLEKAARVRKPRAIPAVDAPAPEPEEILNFSWMAE